MPKISTKIVSLSQIYYVIVDNVPSQLQSLLHVQMHLLDVIRQDLDGS